ncbi:MAG: signal peptidase I [Candidatus Muiribacteriota bacterium]
MLKLNPIIRDWLEIIVSSLIIVFLLKQFIITTYQVPSSSMEPAIDVNSRIIVSKISSSFKREDIIAFKNPLTPKVKMIKRVIGLPGDFLQIKNRQLYINNKLYKRFERIDYIMIDPETLDYIFELKIPDNHFFLVGDNINFSRDSRNWGLLEESEIIGRALLTYWPPKEFGGLN